jgi:hypothetical protein
MVVTKSNAPLYRRSARFQDGVVRDVHMGIDLGHLQELCSCDYGWKKFTLCRQWWCWKLWSHAILEHEKARSCTALWSPLKIWYARMGWEFAFAKANKCNSRNTSWKRYYSPHLHFQIMTDMQGHHEIFLCAGRKWPEKYSQIILDPNPFIFGW